MKELTAKWQCSSQYKLVFNMILTAQLSLRFVDVAEVPDLTSRGVS
jgi:hypothetical protein